MIGDIKWQEDLYAADGKFITDVYLTGKYQHKYFNKYFCYYNYLKNCSNNNIFESTYACIYLLNIHQI